MKVEDPRSPHDASVSRTSAEAAVEASRQAPQQRVRAGEDGVNLSDEARLVHDAIRAASVPVGSARGQEAVRSDAVARGLALLESGTLGADAEQVADALIESLLESHEPGA